MQRGASCPASQWVHCVHAKYDTVEGPSKTSCQGARVAFNAEPEKKKLGIRASKITWHVSS